MPRGTTKNGSSKKDRTLLPYIVVHKRRGAEEKPSRAKTNPTSRRVLQKISAPGTEIHAKNSAPSAEFSARFFKIFLQNNFISTRATIFKLS